MKKIFLFVSPLIFLVACSSGGGDSATDPLPTHDFTGVWELTELEVNGNDLMPTYSEALYYYHSNGTYELKGYLADSSYANGVGEYSISNDIITSKGTTLTGVNEGLYISSSSAVTWVNENEVTVTGTLPPCLGGGTGYSRSVKTTNSLGSAPSNSIVGVWEATYANLGGQDILTPNYNQVLYYYFADGSVGTELYFLDGSFDWASGTYSISGNVITTSSTLNSTQQTITGSMNITKLEIDKAELYTSDFLGTGDAYTLKASKVECVSLSNWKK